LYDLSGNVAEWTSTYFDAESFLWTIAHQVSNFSPYAHVRKCLINDQDVVDIMHSENSIILLWSILRRLIHVDYSHLFPTRHDRVEITTNGTFTDRFEEKFI
jgi:hypothetical protein